MTKIAKMTDVTGCTDINAVLSQSGTMYDVKPVVACGNTFSSGGYKALVRSDTQEALAFVSDRFRPNDHKAQLAQLDPLILSGDIQPVSVAMWDNGSILAYQFRCPGLDVHINGKDMVSPLLTMLFSYGFKLADSAFFADFRWFCKNQLGKVAELSRGARVLHRAGVHERFSELVQARIGQLGTELSGRYGAMRRMLEAPMPTEDFVRYSAEILDADDMVVQRVLRGEPWEEKGRRPAMYDVLDCYAHDDAGAQGTVWHAYNAVTRYETHKAGHTAESRTRRMLMGAGMNHANKAWELASARLAA